MRRPISDETNRANIAPLYLATMIGAACFGVSWVIDMPSDFAYLGLYVMFVGCAAMTLPERGMWCTIHGPIGIVLAVTMFCVSAIPGRPAAFASVSGVLGFVLLVASAVSAYAVLARACRFLLRSRPVSTEATHG